MATIINRLCATGTYTPPAVWFPEVALIRELTCLPAAGGVKEKCNNIHIISL